MLGVVQKKKPLYVTKHIMVGWNSFAHGLLLIGGMALRVTSYMWTILVYSSARIVLLCTILKRPLIINMVNDFKKKSFNTVQKNENKSDEL